MGDLAKEPVVLAFKTKQMIKNPAEHGIVWFRSEIARLVRCKESGVSAAFPGPFKWSDHRGPA
jgi:hypothetical protein